METNSPLTKGIQMTNIVALIAATVLNLQTHLIPVKSNEALTDFAMIEQIPMTQAQRVEKAKNFMKKVMMISTALRAPLIVRKR